MKSIKIMRIKRGMTQNDLAKKLNVTNYTVSNWEQGKTNPSLPKLKQTAEILNCTVNDLIEE